MVRCRRHVTVLLSLLAAVALAGAAQAASQMFPSKRQARGLSAYLVKPTEGMDAVPEGWTRITSRSFGNSALAGECLTPKAKAAPCTTTSTALPRADYVVSILVRGKGRARLKGAAEWTEFAAEPSNYYRWIEIGEAKGADRVSVELAPPAAGGQRTFWYGGLLAEGSAVPVVPVAKVFDKLRKGRRVTVVLLGDSVTENSGGTGGGASKFERGNPGLMLAFLRETSGTEPAYITHRSPPAWPADRKGQPEKIPTVEIGGKVYYDSRIELDASKPVRLVNLGKGGAAANWGWSRMDDLCIDQDYIDRSKPAGQRRESVRHGLAHYKPDLVIVNFGTNDVNGSHAKWTVEDYLFHMKVLATNIQQRFGAAVILSAPHKWTSGVHLFPHLQPQMVEALRRYCAATGFALADVYNEYPAGLYDGIHPRDAGHTCIADAYKKAIRGEPSAPAIKARVSAADLADNGDGTVTLAASGLMWTRDANLAGGAKTPQEAAEFLKAMNAEKTFGHDDWRLPTRDELLGLVDPSERRPALPRGHPFTNVVGWYQTSNGTWGVDLPTGVPYAPSGRAKGRVGFIWPVRTAK